MLVRSYADEAPNKRNKRKRRRDPNRELSRHMTLYQRLTLQNERDAHKFKLIGQDIAEQLPQQVRGIQRIRPIPEPKSELDSFLSPLPSRPFASDELADYRSGLSSQCWILFELVDLSRVPRFASWTDQRFFRSPSSLLLSPFLPAPILTPDNFFKAIGREIGPKVKAKAPELTWDQLFRKRGEDWKALGLDVKDRK